MLHLRQDYQERIVDTAGLIPEAEPIVFIRAQDAAAVPAINAYIVAAEALGVERTVIEALKVHRQRIVDWQNNVAKKPASVPLQMLP